MPLIDKDEVVGSLRAIGEELAADASDAITPEERQKVAEWTLALGVAAAKGDAVKVKNYGTAISGVWGAVEFTGAEAATKARFRIANLALNTVVKILTAALL